MDSIYTFEFVVMGILLVIMFLIHGSSLYRVSGVTDPDLEENCEQERIRRY